MHLPFVIAAISITSAFEGGSTGPVRKVSETHWRIGVAGQTDQNQRNRQASWYYFRVDGATPSQPLTIDMVDLPGEYNFKPNRGAITGDTPPVISYDGETWEHLTTVDYDAAEPRLRLKITPKEAGFRVAHTPPYTNEDLGALRKHALSRGAHEEIIGKSVEGRNLLLWTIGSGPRTVWLMIRQHAWESGTSWVAEGAVRALLQNDHSLTWKILPMCDPDGVARGGVRFNVYGYDLNRNWDVNDPKLMPEITVQRNAIAAWVSGGRTVDLLLTLHNTETAEYLQAHPGGVTSLGKRLFETLVRRTAFSPSRPLSSSELTTTEGMRGRMTVVQGLWRDLQIPAYLLEQRIAFHNKLGRFPSVKDRIAFGADLTHAIAEALSVTQSDSSR